MPLGAARLNTLSKVLSTPAANTIDAVSMPSATNYADTTASFSGSGNNVTVAFWFKGDTDPTRFKRFFTVRYSTTNTFITAFRDTDAQSIAFYSSNQARSPNVRWWFEADVGSNMFDDEWHHVMISTDHSSTGNTKVYWDGQSKTVTHNNTNSAGAVNWGTYDRIGIGGRTNATIGILGDYAQFFIDDAYLTDITKFYDTTNNRAVDMGTNGTGTGLSQPRIFHYGNTSTFPTNNGTDSYGPLSTVGTGTITDATGPETS
jgi:hypothetical protein